MGSGCGGFGVTHRVHGLLEGGYGAIWVHGQVHVVALIPTAKGVDRDQSLKPIQEVAGGQGGPARGWEQPGGKGPRVRLKPAARGPCRGREGCVVWGKARGRGG